MTGYRKEKQKTPKRFFWRLCLQSIGAFGVFLMILCLFHSSMPGIGQWQLAVRESFIDDADFTPVMEWLYDTDWYRSTNMEAMQVGATLPREQVRETIVIPVSGTVIAQDEKPDYLYVQTDGSEAVLAAYAGTVTDIFTDEADRMVICISHANGIVTTYGGCEKCYVTIEEPVKKGQVIGRTAAITEERERTQSRADFYFAASYLGTVINPLDLLQQQEIVQKETAL